ncbi:DUF4189 domain-containing protein [bacterium]|nr:DUF4189 domain-containing protein [bacterium]
MNTSLISCVPILLLFNLTIVSTLSAEDQVIRIDPNSFAAIAYSPGTRRFCYESGYRSRQGAEQAALEGCPEDDARIVGWINNGFLVLALGEDDDCWGVGYVYGGGITNKMAERRALAECEKRTTHCRIVVCLSSDGQHVFAPPVELLFPSKWKKPE